MRNQKKPQAERPLENPRAGAEGARFIKPNLSGKRTEPKFFSYRCGFFRAAGFIPAAFSYSKSGGKKCSNFRTLYSEQYKQSILT